MLARQVNSRSSIFTCDSWQEPVKALYHARASQGVYLAVGGAEAAAVLQNCTRHALPGRRLHPVSVPIDERHRHLQTHAPLVSAANHAGGGLVSASLEMEATSCTD